MRVAENKTSLLFALFSLILVTVVHGQKIITKKHVLKDTICIDYINPFEAPIEFSIKPNGDFKNKIFAKETFILKANDTFYGAVKYLKSFINDSTKTIDDFLTVSGKLGHKDGIKVDKKHKYLLPFPKGKSYRIMQGNKSNFSHNLSSSLYATDFDMNIGDTITAARKGKVIFVKQDSQEYGSDRSFMGKANLVVVMHEDGTYGLYLHLDLKSALVRQGDLVKEGQPLGLVGMSGFTTKPHLHFVVQKEKEISVPIKFVRHGKLKENKVYSH